LNYKVGLTIARPLHTEKISRQEMLNPTDCRLFLLIRLVYVSDSFSCYRNASDCCFCVMVAVIICVLRTICKRKRIIVPFFCFVQWGYVVITTPDGVLDHEEAIKKNVGGQVLGYFH